MEIVWRLDKVRQTASTRSETKSGRARSLAGIAVVVLVILGLLARSASGQSYQTSTGMPSFSAPVPVELGFVDASNGNLHLSIPLGSYPQRGTSQPEQITLQYDSNIWSVGDNGGGPQWIPNNGPGFLSHGGWYLPFLITAPFDVDGGGQVQNCTEDTPWMDQNGTVHYFHLNTNEYASASAGCASQADAYATDSSGYHLYTTLNGEDVPTTTIYAPDGTLVAPAFPNSGSILTEDSNGNYMSTPAYSLTDTLGRQIANLGGDFQIGTVTIPTSLGTPQYQIAFSNIYVQTDFKQQGVLEWNGALSSLNSMSVIRSLTLPDAAQSTYTFTYDCDSTTGNPACGSPGGQSAYYGELIGITLPTGGTVSYSYTTFTDAYKNKTQWVNTRSAAGGSWTYQPQVVHSCSASQYWPNNNCEQQTTVTSPTGQTVYTFQLNNGAWPATVVQKDAVGNTLSTTTNTWDFSQKCVLIGCSGSSFVTLSSQLTTIPAASGTLTKQVSYTYDSPQTGNKTAVKEWQYSASGTFPSVPDRATYTTYLTTGTNDINRPLSVTRCNNSGSDSACPGGGSKVSRTLYTYDCYSGTGCTALTSVTGVAQHDDANFGTGYAARGNATSISQWVSGSNYLTTNYTYDTTGQVLTQTDPAGNVTHYGYADSFFTDNGNDTTPANYAPAQPTNAYVTSVKDAIGTQTTSYYWGSGKVAGATDYNQQSTTSHYQDGLDRQTEEIDPIGWSLAAYSSANQSDMYTAVADTSPSTACISCQHTQTILDSWGRTGSQSLVNNPIGPVEVDSSYDAASRLNTQSHSYSGSADPNHVFETFGYDALDRQTSVTHPDKESQQAAFGPYVGTLGGLTAQQGAASTYGYGYPQISVDESGNARQQWVDGFGRIIEVDEPSTSGGVASSPIATNYLYDAADHLTQVIQGSQTRTFAYDGLGRKISESTPEGGTVTYAYTTSGALCSGDPSNVCQRTDARGVVSTYTYDHANRLTGVAYTIPSGKGIAAMPNVCTTTQNNTAANVCYYYDQGGAAAFATGRLTQMIDATGSESYSYDANGRVTQLAKVVNGQTYTTGYLYDAGGDVTQITYPSGRVVYQSYNQVGQLCQIAPSATNCTPESTYYAANFSYNAPGNLLGFNYGNGVTSTFYYSPDRTQLVYLAYGKGNSTYFNLQYSYRANSQYSPPCAKGTQGNNGSIQCITDNVDSGRSMSYGYDPLQRVSSANSCGSSAFPQWGLSESFDRFGNRWSQTVTAGSGPSSSLAFGATGLNSSTTNRPNGYTYDPSGNMTVEPVSPPNTMTYDGENRMTAFSGNGGAASYTYDGNGTRVAKSGSGTTTVSIYSGSSVIAEYDNGAAPGSPTREYIYNSAGGATTGLLAMIANGATTYYHQDHLSVRLTTDASGNILSQQGSYPYGESWYQSGAANQFVFTSYSRDSESGLDYALARYYDSRTGTFCSADPLAGSPDDPQSWNRYAYARNNPILNVDPSGKGWLSWVLDIGIGIGAAFLPELAPAWFSAGTSAWGAVTVTYADDISTAVYTWGSSTLASVTGGALAGATAASATNPPQAPQTPEQRFNNCNSQYGDANSKAHLDFHGFQMAQNAANSAGIGTNQELALWDNEQSFQVPALTQAGTFPANSAGAVGPVQITPNTSSDLSRFGQLPSNYGSDAYANLLAGARYFNLLMSHYGLSATRAAAGYLGGPRAASRPLTNQLRHYQQNFNRRSATMQKLVNCVH